eukprot:SAG11_NODE_662_length_7875_cov_17.557613_3_plen_80_part_00
MLKGTTAYLLCGRLGVESDDVARVESAATEWQEALRQKPHERTYVVAEAVDEGAARTPEVARLVEGARELSQSKDRDTR